MATKSKTKSKAKRKQAATVKMPSNEWRDAFKAFTLRPNFVLALSRSMLEFMCAVSDDVQWDRSTYGMRTIHAPDNWLSTSKSLVNRGLIVRKEQEAIEGIKYMPDDSHNLISHYVLTPAGEKVVDLLRVSGMFIEHDNAIHKKQRA